MGADVYSLYPVVDVIAHEYEFGNGNHMASARTPLDWFAYQVGMHSFRAFAQGKATWILNYSWDGDKKVDKREVHDEPGHVADHGRREFLGRARALHGRLKRSAYPEEDLLLDQGAREDFLSAPEPHSSGRSLLFSADPQLLSRTSSSAPTGAS